MKIIKIINIEVISKTSNELFSAITFKIKKASILKKIK